jgi:hypothetical protein
MDDRLLQSRARSILRLLRQNFGRVEGPLLHQPNRVLYRVWTGDAKADDPPGVEFEFPSNFLGESAREFGVLTLEALQRAKSFLRGPKEGSRDGRSISAFRNRSLRLQGETIGTARIQPLYTIRPC